MPEHYAHPELRAPWDVAPLLNDPAVARAQKVQIAETTARLGITDYTTPDDLMTPAMWLLWYELRTRAINAGHTAPGDLGEHRATFREALSIQQAARDAAQQVTA